MSHSLFLPVAGGSTIWGLILDLSLKVTALYLLAMLLHLLLGRRRPLSRSGLWNAILAGLIGLPVATLAFPRLRVDLPRTPASHLFESKQANDAATETSPMAIGPRIDDLAVRSKEIKLWAGWRTRQATRSRRVGDSILERPAR